MMPAIHSFESVAALTQGNIPSHGFPQGSMYADMEHIMAHAANPAATISIAAGNGAVAGIASCSSIPDLISSMSLAAEQVELIRAHAARMQCETQKEELQRQAAAKAKPAAAKFTPAKAAKTQRQDAGLMERQKEFSLFERACARNDNPSRSAGAEADAAGAGGVLSSFMEALSGGGKDIADRLSGVVSSLQHTVEPLIEHSGAQAVEPASAKGDIFSFFSGGTHISNASLGYTSPGIMPSARTQGFALAA